MARSAATYSEDDFARMAAAIGRDLAEVARYANRFDAAAMWYRLGRRRPRRIPPSKMREKLTSIARNARNLLRSLGVDKPEDAEDGPGDIAILEALASTQGAEESSVIIATRRIGRLAEILEAIEATEGLQQWARQAADEETELGKLTVLPGHQGNAALNDWIAEMMRLYREITGADAATSVGGPGQPNEGVASGPLIRFLAAAGKPLLIPQNEDAWRSRVRTLLQNPD